MNGFNVHFDPFNVFLLKKSISFKKIYILLNGSEFVSFMYL